MENSCPLDQEISVACPSKPKTPRIEGSLLESLRASLKEEITSEIKNLLVESQREMLRLLKPDTRENAKENVAEETENETRSFYTPTKSVRIRSTQNNDTSVSRNRRYQLLSKLEQRLNKTSKTLRRRIAAKLSMHLIDSLIKLNRVGEVLLHGNFFANFIKS